MAIASPTYRADYSKGRQLGSREIFTRASVGTVVNHLGRLVTVSDNRPRLSFDPLTLACEGFLMEGQSTNLFTNSEIQDGLSGLYSQENVSLSSMTGFVNAVAFPAGKIYSHIDKIFDWVAGTRYTLSAFVEMDDGLAPVIPSASISSASNDFGLTLFNASPAAIPTITHMGGKLYRVSAWQIGPSSGIRSLNFGIYRYTTSTGRGFKVTGLQLEVGSGATSYIPTAATTVTRDSSRIAVSPANFSKMLRADEGTVLFRGRTRANRGNVNETLFTLVGVSNRDYLVIRRTSSNDGVRPNQIVLDAVVNNSNILFNQQIMPSPVAGGQDVKVALTYRTNKLYIGANGAMLDMSNLLGSNTVPPFAALSIGYQGEVASWGGTIAGWETRARSLSLADTVELTK